ncbi:MAG TPA: hypothetical protein PKD86_03545 [Gemmatales bacterium]|nr:hypothetical protein [Gemmatales bacterium]HMP58407.1 hypothetical protein [Gemmatales bacterium]
MQRFCLWATLWLLLACPALWSGADPDLTRAEEAAHTFMTAVQHKNLDDLQACVDVPWFHDGKVIIHDKKDLAREFDHLFQKRMGPANSMRFQLIKTVRYAAVVEKVDPEERKLAEQVITPRDFLCLVQIQHAETQERETVAVFIRQRDGQTKIVGLKN